MRRMQSTSHLRLAAGVVIVVLALAALLAVGGAQPTEANGPDAQFTALFNPNLSGILLLQPTATPVPFDLSTILVQPGSIEPFVDLAPVLSSPTPIPTPLPCGHAVIPGKPVTGSLTAGGQHCDYTFDGSPGQSATITMRRAAGNIDPLITLRAPNGAVVATDDDGDGRSNSAIRNVTLDQSGTYTLIARSLDPAASGSFQLSLDFRRPSQPAPSGIPGDGDTLCTGRLKYGGAIQSQVPFPGAECRYTFEATRGDSAALFLKSLDGSPLPGISVVDSRGKPVQADQSDIQEGSVTQSDLFLGSNGTYTIVLTDETETGTGPFELSVIRQDPCKKVMERGSNRILIAPNNPSCTLTLLDNASFFSKIQVSVLSGDVDPVLQFYGPYGEFLGQQVAADETKPVPANTWTVVVEGAAGTEGIVDVFLSGTDYHTLISSTCARLVHSGDFIRDTLTSVLPNCRYTFEGQAGDVVTIRMTRQNGTTSQLDPFLTLRDPDDQVETIDDDGGLPPNNSLIRQYQLQSTGNYTIVAGAYNDSSTGAFYLTFWKRSP